MGIIGYARTSINDNDLTSQLDLLTNFRCTAIYQEDFSTTALSASKRTLDDIVLEMQPNDVLVVSDLHRLGKSTRQLTELTQHFKEKNLHLVSITERIDTREPMGDLYFKFMDSLAAMECSLIKERTLVGLNEARKKGKIGGRPKIDGKTIRKIRRLYYEKRETIQYISSKCGVSVGTCYKYINLSEAELENLL